MSVMREDIAPCPAALPAADARIGRSGFDQLAQPYRWLEYLTFGPLLQRCRTHFLPQVAHCQRALVLGDGDGRFTARLLHTNPRIHIHAVDASSAMLKSLDRNAGQHRDRITVEQADLRVWAPSPDQSYDLITTHFFLDCLTTEDVAALASRIYPVVARDALWLVSDFAIPPTPYGNIVAKPLIAMLYRTFRLLTGLQVQSLPDHASALSASAWSLGRQYALLKGLLNSQLWHVQHASPSPPIPSDTPGKQTFAIRPAP